MFGTPSLTKDAVDRTEQPFMAGLGEHLVRGTAPSIVTDKATTPSSFFTVAAQRCHPERARGTRATRRICWT